MDCGEAGRKHERHPNRIRIRPPFEPNRGSTGRAMDKREAADHTEFVEPLSPARDPFWRGGWTAVFAAVAFGASTPFVQRFGRDIGPFLTAAWLYLGAA